MTEFTEEQLARIRQAVMEAADELVRKVRQQSERIAELEAQLKEKEEKG